MTKTFLNWKVAGFAGEGIMTTGLLFSKTASRHGLYIHDYTEYPSLIRGGHNTYQVVASPNPVYAQRRKVDVLVALNKNGLTFHKDELTDSSWILYDQEDDNIAIEDFGLLGHAFNLPMVRLAKSVGADRLMANNVALGASIYFLGLDIEILNAVIAEVFGKKGEKVIKLNQAAAKAGFDYAAKSGATIPAFGKGQPHSRLGMTGNEAVALGAIAGGLQFYAAYPMTPSSSVLHTLAAKAKDGDFVVKHAEDEISVINMALGAAFAGVRAMVGTAGGGFCYMTEALGLAGVAEIPLVVFEGQRPGPALGMPTWTAQGDLLFVINASQDEFPRFVLAPGDAEEAFHLTKKALELAEKYHTLVILLSDKYLAESRHTMELAATTFTNERVGLESHPQPDESGFFPRYRVTDEGVSPRTLPGTPGGTYVANSYEHDAYGLATEEGNTRTQQMDKRFQKFSAMKTEIPAQFYEADPDPAVTFISFGSTKTTLRAARNLLAEEGVKSALLNLSWLWPFPKEQVKKVITESKRPVIVEGNSQGQLGRLIRQETGLVVKDTLHRYDGRPFYPEDIVNYVINDLKPKT